MKMNIKQLLCCILVCLSIQSCSLFSGKGEKMDHLTGIVKDDAGNPLKDVVVTSANVSVKTDENGVFNLERIGCVNSRYVVSFSCNGYFRLVKSGSETSSEVMQVVMQPTKKEGVSNSTTFSATKGGKVKVGKTQVNIPSNSLVSSDGKIYKGNVNFKMLYLDPKREEFAATMPGGDLAAKDNEGNEKMLVSYGMIDVVMTDDKGGKLQLKYGTESEITFPIPEGMADKAPDEMPLWSFNEDYGVWEQSGVAVRDGDCFKGTVGHFSWVNLDDPKDYCELYGKVEDEAGNPIAGLRISVEQVSVNTKEDGSYSLRIPAGTEVNLCVKSDDYCGYTPEYSITIPAQSGNSKHKENIKLPTLPTISGQLKNTCSDSYPFTLLCKYKKDGKDMTTGLSMCKVDGSFKMRLPMGATSPVLYISAPDGQVFTQEITFEDKEANLEPINVCYVELVKREQPQLSVDGKETPINYDDCDYIVFSNKDKDVSIGFNKDLEIEIKDYNENTNKFNATIKLTKQGYESTSAQVEKNKVDNKVQLKITSVGKVTKDSVKTDATFNATVYSTVFYNGSCSSLSKICLPVYMNSARMPVALARQQDIIGMPDIWLHYASYAQDVDDNLIFKVSSCGEPMNLTLSYKDATKADVEKFGKQLESRGFKLEKSTSITKYYKLNDIEVQLSSGNLVLTKGETSRNTKMVVSVTTGLELWVKNILKKYLGIEW